MPSPGGWDQPQPIGVPQNVQNLSSSIAKWINRPWDRSTADWTPVLTATAVNPTMGTASVASGKYLQVGKEVYGFCHIKFGTAGAAAGTGTYRVNTPVTAASLIIADWEDVGSGLLFMGLAGYHCEVVLHDVNTFYFRPSSNYLQFVTDAVPAVWANNYAIDFRFRYEAAS